MLAELQECQRAAVGRMKPGATSARMFATGPFVGSDV